MLTSAATLLLLGACSAWFVLLAWRRLRAPELRSQPVTARLRALGLGVLLTPVVLTAAGITGSLGGWSVLLSCVLALAAWTFTPRYVTTKVLALSLVAAGLWGFVQPSGYVEGYFHSVKDGIPLAGLLATTVIGHYRQILTVQGLVFIVAGLWLAWRAVPANRLTARLLLREPSRVPGQQGRPRWGLLLAPVAGLFFELFFKLAGQNYWTNVSWWTNVQVAAIVLAAIFLAFSFPAFAADLALAGLALFGLYGIALGFFWPTHVPLPYAGFSNFVRYGVVWVDGRASAVVAGLEGSVLTGLAVWLAPRAVDDKTRALFRSAADAELATRVVRLTTTRAEAVDSAAAELRRLERDLHDGAQARLIALGINLRAAERLIQGSPEAATALVAEARETSSKILDELRGLLRGICPPVLADRGLGDAIRALALDAQLPIDVDIDLPRRPPLTIESACYFAVAEVLTNAVKHSGARRVQVRIGHADGALRITVIDDGCGGADPERGTGLLGLERRLGTHDGVLAVNSPAGGPTIVAIEVPCELSAQKLSVS
jgi:signal transduction histidine kinase